ncbi:hypothetical protein X975_18720, partial [Stegodyphus mimosarum]
MLQPTPSRCKMTSKQLLYTLFASFFVLLHLTCPVSGHGRLVEPPSRSSMWRFGFKTKPNYNDNELFCGGYTVQWQRNGGKCGICGDAWHLPSPRPNEAGGVYGRGIIVRQYKPGQVIKSTVDITANHRGFFEFKLCPHNSPSIVATQSCLDQYPLELADGSGTKYYPGPGTGPFSVQLRLPDHLTCTQCVFQWTYTAGNNWGRCENGTSKVGCGPQETFRGCADIAIDDSESNAIPYDKKPSYERPIDKPSYERPDDKPSISAIPTRRATEKPRFRPRPASRRPYYQNRRVTTTTRKPITRRPRPSRPVSYYNVPNRRYTTRRPVPVTRATRRPIPVTRATTYRPIYTARPSPHRPFYNKNITKKPRPTYKAKVSPKKTTNIETESDGASGGGRCRAVGVWASISGMGAWCDSNCARGYCPSTHCDCS